MAVHPDIFGVYATAFRGPDAESVLLKLAHSISTLIMAYGFDLEAEKPNTDSEDKDSQDYRLPKGMIPLADMLNADGDSNNVSPLSAFFAYPQTKQVTLGLNINGCTFLLWASTGRSIQEQQANA